MIAMSLKKLKFNRRFFIKRKHFRLGYKSSVNISLKCTRANVFITLTDIKGQVIVSKSSGSSGITGTRKKKISPYVIESMIYSLIPYIKLYKIKSVNVVFKSRSPIYYPFLIKNLNINGLFILKWYDRYCVAHNGVRAGKAPRK